MVWEPSERAYAQLGCDLDLSLDGMGKRRAHHVCDAVDDWADSW